jgi:hypothetical protein
MILIALAKMLQNFMYAQTAIATPYYLSVFVHWRRNHAAFDPDFSD